MVVVASAVRPAGIRRYLGSGLCVVAGCNAPNGADLVIWDCTGGSNQTWKRG